jgi:protein-S-isoprenylcysteine O-methyltransferase Ste14
MQKIIRLFLLVVFSIVCQPLFAQEVEMADGMRSSGKIYVIVAIVLIVLAGLIAYLFLLDRKISNLEKRANDLK